MPCLTIVTVRGLCWEGSNVYLFVFPNGFLCVALGTRPLVDRFCETILLTGKRLLVAPNLEFGIDGK